MNMTFGAEYLREKAKATLLEIDLMKQLPQELPGEFTFQIGCHRLEVSTLEQLHEARTILRKHYGWSDSLDTKFFSCGRVIVTFQPNNPERLPLPFQLWVATPPEQFPASLLGDCQLIPCEAEQEYYISCPL